MVRARRCRVCSWRSSKAARGPTARCACPKRCTGISVRTGSAKKSPVVTAPQDSAFGRALKRALQPYPSEDRYLVGVSGGRDSVALLHALTAAGYQRLVVCHLEHNLRGKAGRADARFVERLAAEHGLPSEIGRADVPTLARASKHSPETAAREARHAFFAEVAGRRRCRTLFL